jgi:hypothetical protein
MKIIAHRGNLEGPNINTENTVSQILLAIERGFDAEIDLWVENGKFFLGHDLPTYEISIDFLKNNQSYLWIHCKNLEAIVFLKKFLPTSNFFWHQSDDFALTSKGYIWTYPGKTTTDQSVIVDLSENPRVSYEAFGICTDYPERV